MEDVVQLIENPEAGNAVAKAADIGEAMASGSAEAGAEATTTIGFGTSVSAASPVDATVNVLQVKKRKKVVEDQENSETANGSDDASTDRSQKKAKVISQSETAIVQDTDAINAANFQSMK